MMQPPKRILIIEDETSLLRVLADELKSEGFVTLTATTGSQGLKTAIQQHPDLIFLDIVMPNMDGIHMLQQLREDAWGKSVPVIVLTNVSEAEKIDELLSKGVDAYIVKSDWQLEDIVRMAKEKLAVPTH